MQTIRPAGELFRTSIRVASPDSLVKDVDIVSRMDPRVSRAFDAGDAILVLGVLVDEPLTQLQGYKGPNGTVVLGGFPVKEPVTLKPPESR